MEAQPPKPDGSAYEKLRMMVAGEPENEQSDDEVMPEGWLKKQTQPVQPAGWLKKQTKPVEPTGWLKKQVNPPTT